MSVLRRRDGDAIVRRRPYKWLGMCLALAVLWPACGGSHKQGDPGPQAALQADAIVDTLKAAGMPIGEQQASDASKQASGSPLAPPVRYVTSVVFRDTRLTATKSTIDAVDGGRILVYANADDAQEILRWLVMVSEGAPYRTHDYAHGTVVLNLTDRLTDAQAALYDQALQQVLSNVATPSGN